MYSCACMYAHQARIIVLIVLICFQNDITSSKIRCLLLPYPPRVSSEAASRLDKRGILGVGGEKASLQISSVVAGGRPFDPAVKAAAGRRGSALKKNAVCVCAAPSRQKRAVKRAGTRVKQAKDPSPPAPSAPAPSSITI